MTNQMREPEFRSEANRAKRALGHLNALLGESLPEYASKYEVTHARVGRYGIGALGPPPIRVSPRDEPTYEFYITPVSRKSPRKRVMLLHGPDLRKKIPGGIKNERSHFQIDYFLDNLRRAIEKIESSG